jgi:glutamate/tyrosine decarboxylase-like PLP-dependent enzyme
MTIKENGIKKLGCLIEQNIQQARYLTEIIKNKKKLEILAPTRMNIVNFRYNDKVSDEDTLNKLNEEILFQLQEQGIAVPSNTMINGTFAIRVAIVNHRSVKNDFEVLVHSLLDIAEQLKI